MDQEIRGNATVSVKDEARGFHLNNLSYVGPIVMGFGGDCLLLFLSADIFCLVNLSSLFEIWLGEFDIIR